MEPDWINSNITDTSPVEAPHGFLRMYCANCGAFHDVPIRCSDRLCVPCLRRRSSRLFARMMDLLKYFKPIPEYRWSHLILTQPIGTSLKYQTSLIIRSFAKMRKTNWWKSFCWGGFYAVEAKYNPKGWHVHIHVVIYHKWVPVSQIRKHWSIAMRRRSLCWIRTLSRGKDFKQIVSYILKYATKDVDIPEDRREEYNLKLRSVRMFNLIGGMQLIYREHGVKQYIFRCPVCGKTEWISEYDYLHLRKIAPRIRSPVLVSYLVPF